MDIFYSPKFLRSFKKLPKALRPLIDERINIFRENFSDPRLKTHKLTGKLQGYWSFSLTYKHRIIFELINNSSVAFIDIGDHKVYQ